MLARLTKFCVAWGMFGVASVALADEPPAGLGQAPPPTGFVIVEDDLWTNLAGEPGDHMERARESFLMVDGRAAANELRKAATFLRIEARNAMDQTRVALSHSAHELDQLAQRVEKGTVKSVHELDAASARALHALANQHYARATDAWKNDQHNRCGRYLRAAEDNLERSTLRAEAKVKSATHEVVKASRIVSGKLISGAGFVVDEVGAGFTAIGHQIERVGKGVEPTAPPAK